MTPAVERRMLQLAVALACVVPLAAGADGIVRGAAMIRATGAPAIDLDSHFRYLSGVFLGVGLAFAGCVPAIERRGALFRILGGMVILGGLARLLSAVQLGLPSGPHRFGLMMELGVVPLLMLWQVRVARRAGASSALESPPSF